MAIASRAAELLHRIDVSIFWTSLELGAFHLPAPIRCTDRCEVRLDRFLLSNELARCVALGVSCRGMQVGQQRHLARPRYVGTVMAKPVLRHAVPLQPASFKRRHLLRKVHFLHAACKQHNEHQDRPLCTVYAHSNFLTPVPKKARRDSTQSGNDGYNFAGASRSRCASVAFDKLRLTPLDIAQVSK
jgi:hypothetical protein